MLEAMGQAFFTLSVGMGAIMAYGAYLPEGTSILRTSVWVVVADTSIALLAGLIIFPIVFANGLDPASGPGLIFETLPLAFGNMPGGVFLAPIFFVSVGLHLDFSALSSTPFFVATLILIALLSKFVGAGLPAYWVGMSKIESMMVGVGMSGRGAVELIVAGVALQAGLFLHPSPPPPIVASLYSSIVIMALVTTVLTPLLLQRLIPRS